MSLRKITSAAVLAAIIISMAIPGMSADKKFTIEQILALPIRLNWSRQKAPSESRGLL